MTKLALAAALFLTGLTANAETVEVKCKPNANATVSQFMVIADLAVDSNNDVTGFVQYATRSSATAQTSEVRSIKVSGQLVLIPAGKMTKHMIESYQLVDESDQLIRLTLNVGLDGPNSSTLIVDRKYRYSSQCK